MTTAFDQLVADHRNIDRVLSVLASEVNRYGTENSRGPDLALILEILDYMNSYPQAFHHPLEEQAFDYMLARGIGDSAAIRRIRAQHQEIEAAATELDKVFTAVGRDYPVAIDDIKERLGAYLDLQHRHLLTEEESIFPTMAESLDDSDWRSITAQLTLQRDPLFGPELRRGFTELAKRLELTGG